MVNCLFLEMFLANFRRICLGQQSSMANWFFRTVSGELSANNMFMKSFWRTLGEQYFDEKFPPNYQRTTSYSGDFTAKSPKVHHIVATIGDSLRTPDTVFRRTKRFATRLPQTSPLFCVVTLERKSRKPRKCCLFLEVDLDIVCKTCSNRLCTEVLCAQNIEVSSILLQWKSRTTNDTCHIIKQ